MPRVNQIAMRDARTEWYSSRRWSTKNQLPQVCVCLRCHSESPLTGIRFYRRMFLPWSTTLRDAAAILAQIASKSKALRPALLRIRRVWSPDPYPLISLSVASYSDSGVCTGRVEALISVRSRTRLKNQCLPAMDWDLHGTLETNAACYITALWRQSVVCPYVRL